MVVLWSHFFRDAGLFLEDGERSLNYGLDKVRIPRPVLIGDGLKLCSNISLLDATGKGELLLKTCHEI